MIPFVRSNQLRRVDQPRRNPPATRPGSSMACSCASLIAYASRNAPHTRARISTFPLPAACTDPPDGDRSALVCAYAPIINVSVIATMSAVRISASPVFLRLRDRSKVNRCADEERRELLRCTGGNLRLRSARTGEQQSCLKSRSLRKVTPIFSGIWPPRLPESSCDSRIDDSPQRRLP